MYDTRDIKLLHETMLQYEHLVKRPYLYDLPCSSAVCQSSGSSPICLFKLKNFPSGPSSRNFSYILNALNGLGQVIGYIIYSSSKGFSIYIGLKGPYNHDVSQDLLFEGLTQTFPELELTPFFKSEALLNKFFNKASYTMLSSVSAALPDSEASLLQPFTQLMGKHSSYMAVFLAQPFSRCQLTACTKELYALYHKLSIFTQSSHNVSHSLGKNSSETVSRCDTSSNGNTSSSSTCHTFSCNECGYHNFSSSAPLSLNEKQNLSVSLVKNCAEGQTRSHSSTSINGCSDNHSQAHTNSNISATNKTDNQSISFSAQDKCVQDALSDLTASITRLQDLMTVPCFNFNAYFISKISETSIRAAYTFSGLCQNNSSHSNVNAVNFWSCSHPHYPVILDELKQFNAPDFCSDTICCPSGILIKSSELVNCLFI